MSIRRIKAKLNRNLIRGVIFYIPESVFTKKQMRDFNFKSTLPFNKLIIIDTTGKESFVDNSTQLVATLYKVALLEKNIMLLLEQQEKLTESNFRFLIDTYKKELQIYSSIARWLNNNLDTQIENCSKEVKMYFEVQLTAYINHINAMQKYFGVDESYFSKNQLSNEELFKELPVLEDLFGQDKKDIKSNKNRIKKATLITDEEATNFLLETVFNVKK